MPEPNRLAFQLDGMFEIPGVRRDASALVVHSGTGNLWVITDDDVRLVEFTNQGKFVREVKLAGFEDAEGLCHVEGDLFLVAEEKKMCITLVEAGPGVTKVTADDRRLTLDVKSKKNKGLEGVSYDAATDSLFAVREGKPPAVFRIQPLLGGPAPAAEWPLDLDGFEDLSDTFWDPAQGWLWLLSHESQVAAAFDSQGVRVMEVALRKGRHGLHEDVAQAEGIARDRQGMLYICSEPNHVYRFRPTNA